MDPMLSRLVTSPLAAGSRAIFAGRGGYSGTATIVRALLPTSATASVNQGRARNGVSAAAASTGSASA